MHELTKAQLQLGQLIAEGLTYDEMAERLNMPRRTVIARTDRLRFILNVSKKRQIPQVMRQLGLL